MENEIYQTPEAELIDESSSPKKEFYIVSLKKLYILFMMTLGIYAIYWFHENWRWQKAKHATSVWPVARGLFSIFFAHSLFKKIDTSLKFKGVKHVWSPALLASFYVILTILSQVVERLASTGVGSPYTDLIPVMLLPAIAYILGRTQEAVNLSEEDELGQSNSRFTLANYFWCALGMLMWLFLVIGVLEIFGLITV